MKASIKSLLHSGSPNQSSNSFSTLSINSNSKVHIEGYYNYYIDGYIRSENAVQNTTLSVNAYCDISKNDVIAVKFKWYRIHQDRRQHQLIGVNSNTYQCSAQDLFATIKCEVTPQEDEYNGVANVLFGPIELDQGIKFKLCNALSNQASTKFIANIISQGNSTQQQQEHQFQQQLQMQQKIEIIVSVDSMRIIAGNNNNQQIKLKYAADFPIIQMNYFDVKVITLIFTDAHHVDVVEQIQQFCQRSNISYSKYDNNIEDGKGIQLSLAMENRNQRDLFYLAHKALGVKQYLIDSKIVNKLENSLDQWQSQSSSQGLSQSDILLLLESNKRELEETVKLNQKLTIENQKQSIEIQRLEVEIKDTIDIYTKMITQIKQGQEEPQYVSVTGKKIGITQIAKPGALKNSNVKINQALDESIQFMQTKKNDQELKIQLKQIEKEYSIIKEKLAAMEQENNMLKQMQVPEELTSQGYKYSQNTLKSGDSSNVIELKQKVKQLEMQLREQRISDTFNDSNKLQEKLIESQQFANRLQEELQQLKSSQYSSSRANSPNNNNWRSGGIPSNNQNALTEEQKPIGIKKIKGLAQVTNKPGVNEFQGSSQREGSGFEIDLLKKKNEVMVQELDVLRKECAELKKVRQNQLTSTKKPLDELDKQKEIEKILFEKDKQILDNERAVQDMEWTVKEKERRIEALQSRLKEKEENISVLERQINGLKSNGANDMSFLNQSSIFAEDDFLFTNRGSKSNNNKNENKEVEELKKQITHLQEQVSGQQNKFHLDTIHEEELSEARTEIQILKNKVEAYKKEAEKAITELEQKKRETNAVTNANQKLAQEVAELCANNRRLEDEIEYIKNVSISKSHDQSNTLERAESIQAIQIQLEKQIKANAELAIQLQETRGQLKSSEKKSSEIKEVDQSEALQALLGQNRKIIEENVRLSLQNQKLTEDFEQLKSASLNSSRIDLTGMLEKNTNNEVLQKRLDQQTKLNEVLMQQIRETNEKGIKNNNNNLLQEEITNIKQQLEKSQQESAFKLEQLNRQLKQYADEKNNVQMQIDSLIKEKSQLQSQLQYTNNQYYELQKLYALNSSSGISKSEQDELKRENQKLKEQVSLNAFTQKQLEEQIDKLNKEKNNILDDHFIKSQNQKDKINSSFMHGDSMHLSYLGIQDSPDKMLSIQKQQIENQLREVQIQKDQLALNLNLEREKLKEAQNSRVKLELENNSLKQESNLLLSQLNSLQITHQSLSDTNLQQISKVNSLQNEISSLKYQLELKNTFSISQSLQEDTSKQQTKQELVNLTAENQKLKVDIDLAYKNIKSLEAQIVNLGIEKNKIVIERDTANYEFSQLKYSMQEQKVKDTLELESKISKQFERQLEEKMNSIKDEKAQKVQNEMQILTYQLQGSREDNRKLKEERDRILDEKDTLSKENINLRQYSIQQQPKSTLLSLNYNYNNNNNVNNSNNEISMIQETSKMETEIQSIRLQLISANSELEKIRLENFNNSQNAAKYQQEAMSAKQEIIKLQQEALNTSNMSQQYTFKQPDTSSLQLQLWSLQQSQEEKIKELEGTKQELNRVQSEQMKLIEQKRELENKIAINSSANYQLITLQQKCNLLEEENSKLRGEISELKQKIQKLETESNSLQQQSWLQLEYDALKFDKQNSDQQMKQVNKELEQKVQQQIQRIEQLEKELRLAEWEKRGLQESKTLVQEMKDKAMQQNEQIKKMTLDIQTLEQDKKYKDDTSEKDKQIHKLKMEREEYLLKIEQLVKTYQDDKTQWSISSSNSQTQITQLQSQISSLQSQNSVLSQNVYTNSSIQQQQQQVLVTESQQMKDKVNEIQREANLLKNQLGQREKEYSDKENKYLTQIDSLKNNQRTDLNNLINKISYLESQISIANSSLEEKQSQIISLQSAKLNSSFDLRQRSELDEQKIFLKKTREELGSLAEEKKQLQWKLNQKEEENNNLLRVKQETEKSEQFKTLTIERLTEQNSRLVKQALELQEQVTKLLEEVEFNKSMLSSQSFFSSEH